MRILEVSVFNEFVMRTEEIFALFNNVSFVRVLSLKDLKDTIDRPVDDVIFYMKFRSPSERVQ